MNQVALLGNPNTGKTSLFNHLTGSYEYVGNWSGVTVEKKIGKIKKTESQLIDLPGVYSLNPISRDEGVVTEFLLTESFTSILNIVDAAQLQRNLHLSIQLLEYGMPVVIGMNMMDVAQKRGITIHLEKLSSLLGVKVIPIVARSGKGCITLSNIVTNSKPNKSNVFKIDYGVQVEEAIMLLSNQFPKGQKAENRWIAIQYLEGNHKVEEYLGAIMPSDEIEKVRANVEKSIVNKGLTNTLRKYIYQVRKSFIDDVLIQSVIMSDSDKNTLTNQIDRIVTNKFLGMPIFLLFMYFMFMLTFDWLGFPLSDLLDQIISGPVTDILASGLSMLGVSSFIKELVLNGIVAGVGGVLVFVPQIFILFFCISLLEDSGYMSRVAMVMDRIMEAIGLNGKAFIPMIIGFGCNVPGVMAARTIEQPNERLLTMLLTPLMSCSARLPIYALFVGAFFAKNQALVVFSIYVLGIVVALLLAKLFSSTILKSEGSFFLVELPPYRVPSFITLWRSTWDKAKGFVRKAGTIIFAGSVMIWILSYAGPSGLDVDLDDSYLAMLGGVIAPILAPLGFGTWQAGASLITGFLAKEVIVSTMNIIYHTATTDSLQAVLTTFYTPLESLSFMIFVLLYIPCLATVATLLKETGSKKWTGFSIIYALTIAYTISFAVMKAGTLLLKFS